MPTREGLIQTLRFFLEKLPVDELIDSLITTILAVVGDDDKTLENLVHTLVTHIQAREIIAGRGKLENYEEPHRTELKAEVKKQRQFKG